MDARRRPVMGSPWSDLSPDAYGLVVPDMKPDTDR
jgi:hypothetical protein